MADPVTQQKLYTLGQAATQLSVCVNTLKRWIDAGEIEVLTHPNVARLFVPDAELDRFIRERLAPLKTARRAALAAELAALAD